MQLLGEVFVISVAHDITKYKYHVYNPCLGLVFILSAVPNSTHCV